MATYEEKQRELREIDDQKEGLEKLQKQIENQEDEMERETTRSIQQLNESINNWQEDPRLLKIFYDQQEILQNMQQSRQQFKEESDKHFRKNKQQLTQREEDCYRELQRIEKEEEEKEG